MSAMGDYTLSGGAPAHFSGIGHPFLVISGFRVLNSGTYVSPTFTIGIDIYVIYCGLVNEIRSMTFFFILSKLL